jgi:hypothetical protein
MFEQSRGKGAGAHCILLGCIICACHPAVNHEVQGACVPRGGDGKRTRNVAYKPTEGVTSSNGSY